MEGPNSWEKKEEKFIDTKTGSEVVTEAPHDGFKWREGYVLRRTMDTKAGPHGSATIGGDTFDWVPEKDVEIEKVK